MTATTGGAEATTTAAPTSAAPATTGATTTVAGTGGATTGPVGEGDLDVTAVMLTPDELPPPGQLATTWNTIGGAESAPELFMLLGCGPAIEPPGQPVVDYVNAQYARDFDVAADRDTQELVTVIQRAWELTDANTALDVVRSEVEACAEVTMPDGDRVLQREVVELEGLADDIDALLVRTSASGGGLAAAQSFELWARRGDVVTSLETFTAAPVAEEAAMEPLLEAVLARLGAGGSGTG